MFLLYSWFMEKQWNNPTYIKTTHFSTLWGHQNWLIPYGFDLSQDNLSQSKENGRVIYFSYDKQEFNDLFITTVDYSLI